MIFIGGVQPRTKLLAEDPRSCPKCGHVSLQLKRIDHYLSLFFIPLLPVKKGIPFLSCSNCSAHIHPNGFAAGSSKEPDILKFCRHCQRFLDHEYAFCPFCGRHL